MVVGEDLAWLPSHRAFLLWCLKRSHDDDKWNCELLTVTQNVVCVAQFNDASAAPAANRPVSNTAAIEVPTIVNTRKIQKDQEVVLRWAKPIEKPKEARVKTWQTEISASSAKKPKTAASL